MAKLTRAEFLSELNERIPDNNTRRITPADHRSVEADLAESAVWHDEIGTAAQSDAGDFAPASHTHALADITDAGSAAASDAGDFAAASHQHTASDVTDFAAESRAIISNTLTAGANVTLTPSGDTIRISASGGGGGGGGGDMDAAIYDPTGIGADAFARSNHTGTQAITTVAGLQGALDGKAAAAHTHPASDITDLTAAVQGVTLTEAQVTAHQAALIITKSQVTDFGSYAPVSHTHTLVQITDAGSAASAATGDFATAAQGAKADSAVQPGDLATVAASGDYGDLSNTPALDFAPAAHVSDTDNPHGVTAAQVGLGSVDNTADADKPTSTAQRSGLLAVVNHGTSAATARPPGATAVYWIGSVEPANAEDHDLWHDTAGGA